MEHVLNLRADDASISCFRVLQQPASSRAWSGASIYKVRHYGMMYVFNQTFYTQDTRLPTLQASPAEKQTDINVFLVKTGWVTYLSGLCVWLSQECFCKRIPGLEEVPRRLTSHPRRCACYYTPMVQSRHTNCLKQASTL